MRITGIKTDGRSSHPVIPGLGVTLNEDAPNAHRYRRRHCNLFGEDRQHRRAKTVS